MAISHNSASANNISMNYKAFGRKPGLRVSELALGVGMFGTRWGHGAALSGLSTRATTKRQKLHPQRPARTS